MAYTTINKGSDYFNTVLYTGNGSTQSITGVGFQPDWIWVKSRSGAYNHEVIDVVRGGGVGIFPNLTNAESSGRSLSAFTSDGFTLSGSDTTSNDNGSTYASWNWLAGGTGVSNTDGSITSTVSANTTSGFSIVSYTGTGSAGTIGHGLSSAPKMVIVKERSGADAWIVGHLSIAFTKNLLLNATNAEFADSTIWNDTAPTSSVFSVGSSNSTNQSTATYIAYCFAEKKGFSKFGSYTGNGSTDGTFIYTGFKPAIIILKRTDTTGSWLMYDNKRDSFNVVDLALSPNLSNAEDVSGSDDSDFLSNGIKMRNIGNALNASGSSYIYMAFAESPFVTSSGIPTTAR